MLLMQPFLGEVQDVNLSRKDIRFCPLVHCGPALLVGSLSALNVLPQKCSCHVYPQLIFRLYIQTRLLYSNVTALEDCMLEIYSAPACKSLSLSSTLI